MLNKDDVLRNIAEHLEPVRQLIQAGWDDYLGDYSEHQRLVIHDSTARANIVHCHQMARASAYAARSSGAARIAVVKRLRVLVLGGQCAVRIKKFDPCLNPSNLPTRQVRAFNNQQPLDGLPQTLNLDAGYLLNKTETEIQSIYVVCRNKGVIVWKKLLTGLGAITNIEDLFEERQKQAPPDKSGEGVTLRRKGASVTPIKKTSDEDSR